MSKRSGNPRIVTTETRKLKSTSFGTPLYVTLDWILIFSSAILLVASALLLANGTCNGGPIGSTSDANDPSGLSNICVGARLPIQGWLAIIGLEFSLLGVVVVPRTGGVFISKSITQQLTRKGLNLGLILNSHSSASKYTQLKYGIRKIAILRIILAVVIAGISVMYKFSFVQRDLNGLKGISNLGYVEMGGASIDGGRSSSSSFLGSFGSASTSPLNTNIIDVLLVNPQSYIIEKSSTSNATSIIFGPSVSPLNIELTEGRITRCAPDFYTRSTMILEFIGDNSDSHPASTAGSPSGNNYVKFDYGKGTRFSTNTDYFFDVYVDFGRWNVSFGQYLNNAYLGQISSTTQLCAGFVSWNYSTATGATQLLDPQDINCTAYRGLQATADNSTLIGPIISSLVFLAPWSGAHSTQDSVAIGLELMYGISALVLASQGLYNLLYFGGVESGTLLDRLNAPSCSSFPFLPPNDVIAFPYSLEGVLRNYGSAMTVIGMSLQALAVVTALISLALVLFWPARPVVGEWSAQWLAFMSGIDANEIESAVSETSIGQGRVQSDLKVFLTSAQTQGREKVHLNLSTTRDEME